MARRRSILAVILAGASFCVVLPGCQRLDIEPPEPEISDSKGFDVSGKSPSTFSLPVQLSISEAQQICNQKAPAHFQQTITQGVQVTGFDHEHVDLSVDRKPITLAAAAGNRVSFSIPFSGGASWHGQTHVGPIHGPWVQEDVNFSGNMHGTIGFRINPDWSITPDAHVEVTIDQAKLGFLHILSFDVRGKVQDIVNHSAVGPANQALHAVLEKLPIRSQAESAWKQMHLSRRLLESPSIWLNVQPKEVRVSPVTVEGGLVKVAVGVAAATTVYVDKSAPSVPPTALPGLVIDPNLSNRFLITLPVVASLDELLVKAREAVNGKEFTAEGVSIRVSNAAAEARGAWIVLSFDFSASHGRVRAKGRLFAVGRLQYDTKSETVSVSELDYDIGTKNVLLKVANWVLKPRVLESASKDAKLKAPPLLAQAKDKANQYFAALKAPAGIKPTLQVDKLILEDVRLSSGEMFLLLRAEGTSLLKL